MNLIVSRDITSRRILRIALPILFSNATIPILGAVDTAVIGQLGDPAAIGAVGIGAIIISAIYWVFGFLRMGTVGLTSQAYGAKDFMEVDALLGRCLIVGFSAGLIIILIQSVAFQLALNISPASKEVELFASKYIEIRIFSAPAAIALFGITGWLIALERTKSILLVQLFMNGLNVILDILLVNHFELGIQGVAYASLVAEWCGFILGLYLCRDRLMAKGFLNFLQIFEKKRLTNMVNVNIDILIRSLLLQMAIISFLFIGSDFGDLALASNQILLQFIHIVSYALDGFAHAAETLVGQSVGARDRRSFRQAAILTTIWAGLICIIFVMFFLIFGGHLVDLMTVSPEVRLEARKYLPYLSILPLIGLFSYMLDGIFIGATRTRDMRNMMFISFLGYVLVLFLLIPNFENHGLWFGLMALYILRAVTLSLKYPALEASI
ncbi:MAG: MATE family efflux transporter [Paracoccaceae bacterium]